LTCFANIFNGRKTLRNQDFNGIFFLKPQDECFHPTKPSHIILLPHVFSIFRCFRSKQVIFYFIGAMNFTCILALRGFKDRHVVRSWGSSPNHENNMKKPSHIGYIYIYIHGKHSLKKSWYMVSFVISHKFLVKGLSKSNSLRRTGIHSTICCLAGQL